jgi:TRAP-type C4-dicarboxylate transport system substrate-binding protein
MQFHRISLATLCAVGILASHFVAVSPASARTLKIATVMPDGSSWLDEMRRAADEIKERTAGRVKLKFYPGGVMGNDKTVLRKIRAGQLQGGAFTSGALAAVFPDIELYSLPLMFRNYAEVDYVRERMDGKMRAGLEKAGFVALAVSDGGFAYLLSRKPLRKVEDMGGAKVWIVEDDVMSQIAFDIAGVTPVPLPLADVYTGLQTGLVDTVAAPPMGAIAFQWHTKVRYMTDVPLMYLVGVLVVDRKTFEKLSPEDQAVLRQVVGEASSRLEQETRVGDENAKQALRKQGIEFVMAESAEEISRWHNISQRAIVKLRAMNRYSEAMIEELLHHVESFRAAQPAAK